MRARVIAMVAIGLVLATGRASVAATGAPPSPSAPPTVGPSAATSTGTASRTDSLSNTNANTAKATTPSAAKPMPAPSAAPTSPLPPPILSTQPQKSSLREAAPRPTTDVRVQSRFAVKAKSAQLFAAGEYLSRGDFYNSPGVRVGAAYYPIESLGLELQASHYWSSLNAEAERVKKTLGAIPDSHAPEWMILAGGRYSLGYGKFMLGGLGGAIHFEPQAFLHAGLHVNDGDVGPSGDAGLGLLVFLTSKMFARIDAAIVYDREDRSGQSVSVWGTLPSLGVGGTL